MISRRFLILNLVLLQLAVFRYSYYFPPISILLFENDDNPQEHKTTAASTATATAITSTTTAMMHMDSKTMSILPFLLPWEQEAIDNLKNHSTTCHHPQNTHQTCCPGSFSRGGSVTTRFREDCFHADFDQLHDLARHFVTWEWPLPTKNTTTTTTTTTSTHCDVCRIVDILRYRNEPLTVLGDSMMMQTLDGLHCELERRDYQVDMTSTNRPLWDEGWGNIKTNATLTVRSTRWENKDEVVYIHMYFIYSVPFVISEEAEELNQAGGILLFNFGLHDGATRQLDQLESGMTSFFTTLQANATYSLILFRETTAQHYDTPGGLWHIQPHRGLFCTPLEWTHEVGKRDQAVRNAALAVGYDLVPPTAATFRNNNDDERHHHNNNQIVVLPFHNFTAKLHACHPHDHGDYNNITRGECTHFCSTPLLWIPLWRTLRIAMESALLRNTSGSKHPTATQNDMVSIIT